MLKWYDVECGARGEFQMRESISTDVSQFFVVAWEVWKFPFIKARENIPSGCAIGASLPHTRTAFFIPLMLVIAQKRFDFNYVIFVNKFFTSKRESN